MMFTLVSESSDPSITLDVLQQIARAIQRQLSDCYAPMHDSAGADVTAAATLADAPLDAALVVVLDNADVAGALGYHDVTPDGRAYARIFWGPIQANGGTLTNGGLSLSSVISHEALEAIADPYANWWCDSPDGQVALELADPVEGDSYEIDGVSVSNFVGPKWFREGDGPYDWMGRLTAPFTMSPGGYMIVRDGGGNVRQVFGARFPEWKKPLKQRVHKRQRHA